MNRSIRRLGIALLVCYVALFVQLNYVQVLKADDYNTNPINTRPIVRDFSRPRGSVQSADGVVVARSVPSGDRFEQQREYPEGALFAHISGFFSFVFGTEGVERSYNDELAGRTTGQQLDGLRDLFFADDSERTGNLTLTVRADLQRLARDQLGDREGSVVAIDPRTGAVLALWSFPSYDPNPLASHDFDAVRQARALFLLDANEPLVPASYRERYFPGSTFKVVTAATGIESGQVTTTAPTYPVSSQYIAPLTTRPLQNFGGGSCGGTLLDILRVSCNTAFAQMGVELGPEVMVSGAESFAFNARPPFDLPAVAASSFPDVAFFDENTPALAQSAIGQNAVQATPLHMAMITGAIANGGQMMRPHVVAEVRNSAGEVVISNDAELWRTATSPTTAALVRDAMVGVVAQGTATGMQIPGVTVAAKTGTAQLGTDPPSSHAWIVAFAPAEAPRVAVAVLVAGQPGVSEQTGGRVAAPIARAMVQAVLATPDQAPGGAATPPSQPSVG